MDNMNERFVAKKLSACFENLGGWEGNVITSSLRS